MKKIPGFTAHGTRYRAHVLLDEADALAIAAEAERRRTTASALMRERVVGAIVARPEGPLLHQWTMADGRRFTIYEERPVTPEKDEG